MRTYLKSQSTKCSLTPTANNKPSCKKGEGKREVFRSPDLAFLNLLTGCTLVASYDKQYRLQPYSVVKSQGLHGLLEYKVERVVGREIEKNPEGRKIDVRRGRE